MCGSRCLDVVKEAILCTCLPQEVCVQLILGPQDLGNAVFVVKSKALMFGNAL